MKPRKAEYRITTSASEADGLKLFVKQAESNASVPFLNGILARDAIAKKFYPSKVSVVAGRLEGSSVVYPYLDYPTLEELISRQLEDKAADCGARLVKAFVDFLQFMPTIRQVPVEFLRRFGNTRRKPRSVTCLEFGPIDCVPSNILVDHTGSWHIVDHEWTFEFPVPVDFIVYRGLLSLVYHLSSQIKSCAENGAKVAVFCGYGDNTTYVPADWLPFFQALEIPLHQLHTWEYRFQKQVLVEARKGHLRLKNNPRIITEGMTSRPILTSIVYRLKRAQTRVGIVSRWIHKRFESKRG